MALERSPIPWPLLLGFSVLGTILGVGLALTDLSRTEDQNGWLIHTGPDGPAAELMAQDFPEHPQFRYGEHDGPMFYAIARDPFDLDRTAESLDRPRYRLQHPLFAWLGRLLHPTGSGEGLVWSMFAVGVAAMLLGGVAMGALSTTLRGPPWLAALFPILPGAVMSLRITAADSLAVALMLLAALLFVRQRVGVATAIAVLAVLSKEPTFLCFVGLALWRRDRRSLVFVGVPAAVAAIWALWLRLTVPESESSEVIEFVRPLSGLWDAARAWSEGDSPLALVSVVAAIGLGVWVLVRRSREHPLYWAVALNLLFLLVLDRDVLGGERNGTRLSMALIAVAIVALASPAPLGDETVAELTDDAGNVARHA